MQHKRQQSASVVCWILAGLSHNCSTGGCKQCKEQGQGAQAHLHWRVCTSASLAATHRLKLTRPCGLVRGCVSCLSSGLRCLRGALDLLDQVQARCTAFVAIGQASTAFGTHLRKQASLSSVGRKETA